MDRGPAAGGDDPGRPVASVVIPAYGGAQLLARCLSSLSRLRDPIPVEIVVVLNGARVAWNAEHAAAAPGATVVRSDVNLGFAGGCNLGASVAAGDLLVLLNDDAAVRDGWLSALVRTAALRPDAGAVGSRTVSSNGVLLEAGAVVFTNGYTLPVGHGLDEDSLEWDFVREVDYCSGASLLVRRTAWDAAGGFDDEYHPAYCEDVDLCFRLQSEGWKVLYEPRSCVVHDSGMSTEATFRAHVWRRNHERLCTRWGERLSRQSPPPTWPGVTRAAVERAAERARGWPRHALVVARQDTETPQPHVMATARRLASSGHAVSLAPLSVNPATTDELRDLGVRIIQDLAATLARPETIVDVAQLVGHGSEGALHLLRALQPAAAIIAGEGTSMDAEPGAGVASIPCRRMTTDSDETRPATSGIDDEAVVRPEVAAELEALRREKHHLILDLAVKDSYIVELRTSLAEASQAAEFREAEAGRLAAEVERLVRLAGALEEGVADRDRRIAAMEALLHGHAHRFAEYTRRLARGVFPDKRPAQVTDAGLRSNDG